MPRMLRTALFGLLLSASVSGTANAQISVPAASLMAIPTGAVTSLGCTDFSILGTVSLGAGQINQVTNLDIGASGILDGGQGTISVGTGWNNTGTFVPGASTVIFGDGCGSAPFQLTGSTTFNNLTLSSTTGRTFVIPAGSLITVNGVLTLQGTPALPIQLVSSSSQTAYIALGPGATVVYSNANVGSTVQIGGGRPPIPTLGEYSLMLLALLLAAAAFIHRSTTPRPRALRATGRAL